MDRIVLGYDGSAGSRAALEWVAYRSERRASDVEIVSVSHTLLLAQADGSDEHLDEAVRRLRDLAPSARVSGASEGGGGDASDNGRLSDLIVMGVELGVSPRLRRRSLHLAARADRPVCFVPSSWTPSDLPVAVGLDDDGSSDEALLFACAEAESQHVPLRIVHAWPTDTLHHREGTELPPTPRERATVHRQILDAATERARDRSPDVHVQPHLVHDNAVSALTVDARTSSMLVIGRHRRSALVGWVMGSVGRDLLGGIPTPMCVVPER